MIEEGRNSQADVTLVQRQVRAFPRSDRQGNLCGTCSRQEQVRRASGQVIGGLGISQVLLARYLSPRFQELHPNVDLWVREANFRYPKSVAAARTGEASWN